MSEVLISGASVAGPALAFWLERYGFEPTVVERAPTVREGGQAIDLRGVAREAVERMGIMEDVRRAHTGARGMAMVDGAGKRLASMGADLLGDSGGAIAEIEILRGDLVRILHEATRDGVEYVFGDSIAAISQHEVGVEVAFERGKTRTFDLVVGADGLHSNVRGLTFGDESQFVPAREDGGPLPGAQRGRGQGHVLLRLRAAGLRPPRRRQAEGPPVRGIFRGGLGGPAAARCDAGCPRLLLRQGLPGPHGRLDERADGAGRGRGLLPLADVRYGHQPGAYVLAGELATADGEHRAAFGRYEKEMREYVRRGQEQVKGASGFLLPKSRSQVWLRNQVIRMLPYMPRKGLIAGGVQKAANAIALKDYPPSRQHSGVV
jgi:2-polyprenyl-6-methoxyphenol hydroxylase-like FAD-dependent oxidoreductase